MTPSKALDEILAQKTKIVDRQMSYALSDIITNTPVDKGELKRAWELNRPNRYTWRISNSMLYADVIWGGRRQIPTKNGVKWVGSEKGMSQGGDPILQKYINQIERDFNKIKV